MNITFPDHPVWLPERIPCPQMADLLSLAPLGRPLTKKFFARSVHEVAPDLIGATLLVDGVGGIIVEVEAYHHTDPAAHSYRGPTPRNMVMFGPPGFLYVYRSYGLHWCMNFVCADASAVLIRALEPTDGIEKMSERRGLTAPRDLCTGPGKMAEALGIGKAHDGLRLDAPPFRLDLAGTPHPVVVGPRIGISRAADLPWRFGLAGSPYHSRAFRPS